MEQRFAVDLQRRRSIRLAQRKKTKSYRVFKYSLLLMWVVGFPIGGYLLASVMRDGMTPGPPQIFHFRLYGLSYLLSFALVGFATIVPLVIYVRVLGGQVSMKWMEQLWLTDESVFNFYRPSYESHPMFFIRTQINFSDITRIELNTYHDCFKLYAPVRVQRVFNRGPENSNVLKETVFTSPDQAFRVYYLYYERCSELMQEIARRSGVPITTVDTLDPNIKEARLR